MSIISNLKSLISSLLYKSAVVGTEVVNGRIVQTLANGETVEVLHDFGYISIPPEDAKGKAVVVYPNGKRASNGSIVKSGVFDAPIDKFGYGDSGMYNAHGVVVRLVGKKVFVEGAEEIVLGGEQATELLKAKFLDGYLKHTHPVSAIGSPTGVPIPQPTLTKELVSTKILKGE